jgi:hypothetical protein
MLRCVKSSPPPPLHYVAEGSKDKFPDDYGITSEDRVGYILEEHFVTDSRGYR